MVGSLVGKAGIKAVTKIKKQQDELIKLRKARQKEDRRSTFPSPISKREEELDDILLQLGERPGTKSTITRGMSLEKSPLTKGEKEKLKKLAQKMGKDNTEASEDNFMDYTEKLVEKYGSGVEDITSRVAKEAFQANKKIGGKVVKRKAGGKTVKRKTGGSVGRGMGVALRGGGAVSKR